MSGYLVERNGLYMRSEHGDVLSWIEEADHATPVSSPKAWEDLRFMAPGFFRGSKPVPRNEALGHDK